MSAEKNTVKPQAKDMPRELLAVRRGLRAMRDALEVSVLELQSARAAALGALVLAFVGCVPHEPAQPPAFCAVGDTVHELVATYARNPDSGACSFVCDSELAVVGCDRLWLGTCELASDGRPYCLSGVED